MRAMLIGAFAAMLALAAPAPAEAQRGDQFVGTWSFQTQTLDPEITHVLSGTAIITRQGRGYNIRLVANDYAGIPGEGERVTTAHQRCRGEVDQSQLTITCELMEEMENYSPDNFVLQVAEPGVMTGVLVSASSAQVVFTRVR